jgi:phosphoinositide-3-kinase regulatory subunit 4
MAFNFFFHKGCVIMETMVNDSTCELGDIMEYGNKKTLPDTIVRKLNKIKSSSLRAACRHMLSLDPNERKTASTYRQRLQETGVFPPCVSTYLWPFLRRLRSDFKSPDSRIAYAASSYTNAILHTTTSSNNKACGDSNNNINNNDGTYFDLLVGTTAREIMNVDNATKSTNPITQNDTDASRTSSSIENNDLFSNDTTTSTSPTQISPDTLLIYLQVTLASLRHVQRPSSKIVALQLIQKSSNFLSDDARLQRIVPYVVSLLDDTHASVRASSIRVLASVLSLLQGFPPSDSLVFPQYILKRVSPLVHDESIIVRVAFAESMATLAETAHRFLDVTHATRLYEAVGGTVLASATTNSTSSTTTNTLGTLKEESKNTSTSANTGKGLVSPFSYDVTKLLDQGTQHEPTNVVSKERRSDTTQQQFNPPSTSSICNVSLSKGTTFSAISEVLIPNTYDTELSALQEIVFDWIVHIATDSSSNATFLKRALLSDLARLCAFFGRDGVTSLILPQILAFLNNRADWQLRATLTRHLPSACAVVGRVATQHFVVPCVETAIFDEEEQVTSQALICLASLVNLGLLTRTLILGNTRRQVSDGNTSSSSFGTTTTTLPLSSSERQTSDSSGLLEKYAPLLLHPSKGIRQGMHSLISATCKSIGCPDDSIFVLPILMPYLQYEPSSKELCCIFDLENCFVEPISISTFEKEVYRLMQLKAGSNSTAQTSNVDIRSSYRKRHDNVIHFSSDDCADMGVIVQSGNEAAVECSFLASSESNAALESNPRQQPDGCPRDASPNDGGSDSTTQDPSQYEKISAMHSYLAMTSNYRQSTSPRSSSLSLFSNLPTPNMSAAYTFLFPNQKFIELFSDTVPQWYEEVREAAQQEDSCSLASSFRSLTSVAVTYGIAITAPLNSSQISRKWKGDTTFTLDDIMIESFTLIGATAETSSSERQKILLQSNDSRLIASALEGEWGSMVEIDPIFVDLTLLIEKIQSLHIPPLPPRLGVLQDVNGRPFSWHGPVAVPNEAQEDIPPRMDWRPNMESVVISSSTKNEHTAAVTRLAVSQDQQFFVSASHDGTSRVWNLSDIQDSPTLKSAVTYSGHLKDDHEQFGVRINDICMIENSHSVATCSSNGGVHVWRVDLASATKTAVLPSSTSTNDRGVSRVLGSSVIRHIDYKKEGEVVAVSHFNTSSSSIIAFVTEKGVIHSWDLRCAAEPFQFHVQPELGYLTCFSTLFDRNSFVTGTSRGYISLMDVRYQLCVKVWRHSSESLVSRLATCFTTLPQDKEGKFQTSLYGTEPRPYIFMGCGNNEASVFDISTARCRQCFRILDQSLCYINQQMRLPSECTSMPELNEIPLPRNPNRAIISAFTTSFDSLLNPNVMYSNCHSETKVLSLMGRLGMHGQQQQYLITGGSDRFLRYWDFSSPSKCYTISGLAQGQPRPIYQRVDVGSLDQQLFLCQQMPVPSVDDVESIRYPWKFQRGFVRPENMHQGSILDLKSIEFPSKGMLSCSQDGMIKLWR